MVHAAELGMWCSASTGTEVSGWVQSNATGQLWALEGGEAPKWCCWPEVSALGGWEGGSCGGLRLSACRLTGLRPQELKKKKHSAEAGSWEGTPCRAHVPDALLP